MTPTGTEPQTPDRSAPDGDRPFTQILCAVDGTHRSYAAVEQAAVLAGPAGHLTMLAVSAVSGSGAYRTAAIGPERAERIVERAGRLAERAGVPCTKEVDPAGPPVDVIIARAAEHDLLALGAPGTSWLGGRLVDGVAGAALSLDTPPLLAARSTPGGEDRFPKRMLIASDGLDGSDELVELAIRLARAHGATLALVHVEGSEEHAHPTRVHDQAQRILGALPGSPAARIDVGSPVDAIVAGAAATEASLIIMGTRRATGLAALGSVSRRVLHDAHCSVLLATPAPAGE
jgi:nucleotide-binding universal stress UspA family protein